MDFTDIWVLLQTRRRTLGLTLVGALLFATGWQTGRVMSPYYAAHPIVFQEAVPQDKTAAAAALQDLQDSGVAARDLDPAEARVAGTQAPSPVKQTSVPAAIGQGSEAKVFVGSVNSSLYHHFSCSSAKRIKAENQVWWPTKAAAEAAGYTPSKCTLDKI